MALQGLTKVGVALTALTEALQEVTGSSMVGFQQTAGVATTLQARGLLKKYVTDYGVVVNAPGDQSALIQHAIDTCPAGCELVFPYGTYIGNNINLRSNLVISGEGAFQGATQFMTNSATAPFFKASSVNNVQLRSFSLGSTVTRTAASPFLKFITSHRVMISHFFSYDAALVLDYDGGTEITIFAFQCFTNLYGTGVGAFLFGNVNYTGSVTFHAGYIRGTADDAPAMPEYGVRLRHIDVFSSDSGLTIIRMGHELELVPGAGQICNIVRLNGTVLDTGTVGLFIQPTGGATIRFCEFNNIFSVAESQAGWAIDGTNGLIEACSITGGSVTNCAGTAIAFFGAGVTNFKVRDVKLGNNGIALNINDAEVFAEGLIFGKVDSSTAGNQMCVALNSTARGHVRDCHFGTNFGTITGTSTAFSVYNNSGIDNWSQSNVTVTSSGPGVNSTAVIRARKEFNTVYLQGVVTIVGGGGSGVLVVPVPFPVRTHSFGVGGFVSGGARGIKVYGPQGGNGVLLTHIDDGSYPGGTTGAVIGFSCTYETA